MALICTLQMMSKAYLIRDSWKRIYENIQNYLQRPSLYKIQQQTVRVPNDKVPLPILLGSGSSDSSSESGWFQDDRQSDTNTGQETREHTNFVHPTRATGLYRPEICNGVLIECEPQRPISSTVPSSSTNSSYESMRDSWNALLLDPSTDQLHERVVHTGRTSKSSRLRNYGEQATGSHLAQRADMWLPTVRSKSGHSGLYTHHISAASYNQEAIQKPPVCSLDQFMNWQRPASTWLRPTAESFNPSGNVFRLVPYEQTTPCKISDGRRGSKKTFEAAGTAGRDRRKTFSSGRSLSLVVGLVLCTVIAGVIATALGEWDFNFCMVNF